MADLQTPSLGEKEHIREGLGLVSSFLSGGHAVLTSTTCRKLLDLKCPCGSQHSKRFVSQCAKQIHIEPTIAIRKQQLFEFGYKDVLNIASFAVDSFVSDLIEDVPIVSEQTKACIIEMFEESDAIMERKVADAQNLRQDQLTNIWIDRFSDATNDWDKVSQKLLAACTELKILEQGFDARAVDTTADYGKFSVLQFEINGNDHFGFICPFQSWSIPEFARPLARFYREDNPLGLYHEFFKDVHGLMERSSIDFKGHGFIHLYGLRQTVEWYDKINFEVGSLFNLPSNRTHMRSELTGSATDERDAIMKKYGVAISEEYKRSDESH